VIVCKEFLNVSDKLWVIQRKIRIDQNPIVSSWRSHLRSDKVFKKEPFYYFCEEVLDVEPIEET